MTRALRVAEGPNPEAYLRFVPLAMAVLLTSGCAAVGLTALGVGAAVGVNHTLNGIVYKTFSEPLPKVKRATLTALKQMEIPVEAVEKTKLGELIKARAANRAIEVEFEALTPKTTRMRVVADSEGLVKDSATATEIILQTERALPAT
jgi:citrate lyase gamma subunit